MVLIFTGLLANHWILGYLFSQDGKIETVNLIVIWICQLFLLSAGIVVFLRRRSFNTKKFFFACVTALLIVLAVEIGLHVIDYVVHSNQQDVVKVAGKQYLLSPYEGKDWASDYFIELRESFEFEYQPFLGWRRKSFASKYINVNSRGERKTWNPISSHINESDAIYVFGGSTTWGTGARDEHTLPSYISKILSSKGYNFEVKNYGESSYTFLNEVVYLTMLLRQGMRPEYVIFYDGCNDVGDAYHTGIPGANTADVRIKNKLSRKAPTPIQHIQIGVDALLKKYSMIYKMISRMPDTLSARNEKSVVASKYANDKIQLLSDGIVKHYEESLDLLDNLSRAYNFKYLCFWQPVIYTEKKITDEERKMVSKSNKESISDLFRNVNSTLNAKSLSHFFDISDALDERDETYYLDGCHISEQGNKAVAARIVQILEDGYLNNQ
jgi:lysophospholipase L1-like esterase